jgi:hypothetical protein
MQLPSSKTVIAESSSRLVEPEQQWTVIEQRIEKLNLLIIAGDKENQPI